MNPITLTLTTALSPEEIVELVAREDERRAKVAAAPAMVRLLLRDRNLNSRGNGSETYVRVRLPDGSTGWASDLAQDITGEWRKSGPRAADRRCSQYGVFPQGTIVLSFEKPFEHFAAHGRPVVEAGIVEGEGIRGGLAHRLDGNGTIVVLDDGSEVRI